MEQLLDTCYARDSRYVIHCYLVNHSNKLLMRSWLLYSISGLLLLLSYITSLNTVFILSKHMLLYYTSLSTSISYVDSVY